MGIIETIKKIEREQGFEKGIERSKQEVIENLITAFGLSDKQAARIARVPEAFAKRVRASLKKKK
jgi:hypothetical protein